MPLEAIPSLPGWLMQTDELYPSHWRVKCFHFDGRSVSRDGLDLKALRRQLIEDARTLPPKGNV